LVNGSGGLRGLSANSLTIAATPLPLAFCGVLARASHDRRRGSSIRMGDSSGALLALDALAIQ
jgi:hypothetical protein